MKKILLTLFSLLQLTLLYSQNFCGTDEYNKPFRDNNPALYDDIEKNINRYIKTHSNLKHHHKIIIPVVFHVVWQDNNENIPDSVIHQQIDILNESFNAENADTTILTDTLKNWVGNFNISFELAYRDPDSNITNGITRTHTTVPEFSYWGNYVKFDASYGKDAWPTDRYLNIWVCDLYGGLLGYAQFPGGPQETDGIVLDWQMVGNQIYPWTYPQYNVWAGGRVAVHEVGHWLNLFHPWGNNGMCSDDHIPETGLQAGPIYPSAGCPDTLISNCTPPERVFVKHYMDYCGNQCMVTFTKNQVERGLASLNTYRLPMVENYIPRPTIDEFSETKIYPTYTKGRIYMEFPVFEGVVEIKIYDIMGRLIVNESTSQRIKEIFLNHAMGTYIITIGHKGKIRSKKKIIVSDSSPYGASLKPEIKIKDI